VELPPRDARLRAVTTKNRERNRSKNRAGAHLTTALDVKKHATRNFSGVCTMPIRLLARKLSRGYHRQMSSWLEPFAGYSRMRSFLEPRKVRRTSGLTRWQLRLVLISIQWGLLVSRRANQENDCRNHPRDCQPRDDGDFHCFFSHGTTASQFFTGQRKPFRLPSHVLDSAKSGSIQKCCPQFGHLR